MTSKDDGKTDDQYLLGGYEDPNEFKSLFVVKKANSEAVRRLKQYLLWVIVLFVCLTLLIWNIRLQVENSHLTEAYGYFPYMIPSPAVESGIIRYKKQRISTSTKGNPFIGEPSKVSDRAWHDLVERSNIRVSKDDLDAVNLSSLELADGSGYIAEFAFFHEIHCLKRIRQWVYREHYHSNNTPEEFKENRAHVDHCIEMLRQHTICHADLSLSTFRWLDGKKEHITAEDNAEHQCVDIARLTAWIDDRVVHVKDMIPTE